MTRELAVFSGRAHEQLARDVCDYLGVNLGQRQIFDFSNGNTFVKFDEICRDRDIFIIQPGVAANGISVNDSMMELFIMIDAARRASAWRVNAVVPYYAYGRSDKKDQSRIPITARLMADFFVAAGISRILMLDLHAGQIQGFFPNQIGVDEVSALPLLVDCVRRQNWPDLVVVSTDLGIAKKARSVASQLGVSVAFVNKERVSNSDEVAVRDLVGEVSGRTVLLIDDEVDTAGSLMAAVNVCLSHGAADVYAAAVHGVLSGPAIERIEASPLRELIVTDSVPQEGRGFRSGKVRVLSVAPLLAETIRRIHAGESVGDVYNQLYGGG